MCPLSGAAISIPSSTILFVCVAPMVIAESTPAWAALPIFAAVGLLYPGAVTLLTFAANRALGPVITGTLGNLAPVFAVATAAIVLDEALGMPQIGGLLLIVAGIVVLTVTRQHGVHWRSWYLLLPLAAAALRGLVQPTVKLGLEIWPSPFVAALTSYLVSALVVVAAARSRTQSFQPSAHRLAAVCGSWPSACAMALRCC
jgi:drug/metabolite transporter (DMT)-like permease